MSLDTAALGQRIKAIRKTRGLTQQALSELVDCSPTYISYIERGQKSMSLETLVDIANALGSSVDILLSDSLDFSAFPATGSSDPMFDCNNYERRILADVLLAVKYSLHKNQRWR